MTLPIGNNYSYGYSGNAPKIRRVQGFDPSKIQNIEIKSQDMKKYGINSEDFAKADTSKDGIIQASEFINGGLGFHSIFKAFLQLSESIEGAYEEDNSVKETENQANQNKQPENGLMSSPFDTKNIIKNPKPVPPFMAQNIDFGA